MVAFIVVAYYIHKGLIVSEIPLPAHFEALLKSGEWQTVKPPQKTSVRAMAAEKRWVQIYLSSRKYRTLSLCTVIIHLLNWVF